MTERCAYRLQLAAILCVGAFGWAADVHAGCEHLSGEALENCVAAGESSKPAITVKVGAALSGGQAQQQISVSCKDLNGAELAQCRGKILYHQTAPAVGVKARYRSTEKITRRAVTITNKAGESTQKAPVKKRVFLVAGESQVEIPSED